MKSLKNKTAYIILLTFLLFQNCTVYQKTSISIEEAKGKGKVRVVTNFGIEYMYDNIILKDSIYYVINGKNVRRINQNQLSEIYLKDKKNSSIRIVLVTIGGILGTGIIFIIAANSIVKTI